MSFPTLEQVRTQSNPIQPNVVNGFWTIIDPYTSEYANYKQITISWTDAQCDGFMYIKAGGLYFERVISTPYINVKWFGAFGDSTSHTVNNSINPNTGLAFGNNLAAIQIYYPTAVTYSDQVDGLAIQNAINFAIYASRNGDTKTVWLPSGVYLTSDTIHMGYGETFTSVVLQGEPTYPYGLNSYEKGSAIIPQFSDRPAINVQGTRESLIRGIELIGKNLANPGYNTLTWWDPTQYLSTGLSTNADTQYAPYAGITIDAFSGPSPSVPYPAANYPVPGMGNAYGINITTQYNKNTSSRLQIDHCRVSNFVAGIVQQPSGANAGGDFITTTNTSVNNCKYGISAGGSQGRLAAISNCAIDSCLILVTNAIHGSLQGRINLIENTHFSGYQMLQFVETAYNGQLVLRDCYSESLFKIGYFGAFRTNAGSLTLDNCMFKFDHSNGVPASLVQMDSFAKLTIKGGGIVSAPTLLSAQGLVEMDGVSIEMNCAGSVGTGLADSSLATWSNFITFTGGLPALTAFYPGKIMRNCLIDAHGLATDPIPVVNQTIGNGLGYEGSNIDNSDPMHAIGGYRNYTKYLSSSYNFVTKGCANYLSMVFSNRKLTMPETNIFTARLMSVSDILIDKSNYAIWLVLSFDGSNVILLLLNGYQFKTDGTLQYDVAAITTPPVSSTPPYPIGPINGNTGNDVMMHTGFNRNYLFLHNNTDGALALIGDCTAGTATILNIVSANATTGQVANQFDCIDSTKFLYLYLIPGLDPSVRASSWQGPFKVLSIDTTNFKITVDININVTGKVYLFNTSIYNV